MMSRTPVTKNKTVCDERVGLTPNHTLTPVFESALESQSEQSAMKSPEAKLKTPSKQVLPPKIRPLGRLRAAAVETPSPIRSPNTARDHYPTKADEAKAVYRKGIQNLDIFKNLKASVKSEVRKALDRLYALTLDGSAVRNLNKEMTEDTPPKINEEKREVGEERNTYTLKIMLDNHTTLMKESMTKMEELNASIGKTEELRRLMDEQNKILTKTTYAGVLKSGPELRTGKERTALHSVIISSNNEQDTGEEVLEKVRKTINAKEGWINIEKVRKAKDRKIVVGCATEEERRKLKERLEKNEEQLLVGEVKNRDPLIVLKDVMSSQSDEDIIKAMKNQNREIFCDLEIENDRLTVKFRKKTRNPHTNHVVLMVSPTIWRRALDTKKIRIDLQRVYVEDQSPLVQCSRCLGYGHGRRFCKETVDLCSHCGGPHLSAECPDRLVGEAPECINCQRAKNENRQHNAFNQECPVRIKWDEIARASVAYC